MNQYRRKTKKASTCKYYLTGKQISIDLISGGYY